MKTHVLRNVLAVALLSAFAAQPAQAGEQELLQRLDQLSQEVESLRVEVKALKSQQAAAPAPAPATIAVATPAAPVEPATVLDSYGEINLTIPTHDTSGTQLDLRRFVLGFQHRFNDKTRLVTEMEVEHAVSSAGDSGEVEIEQAYFDREVTGWFSLQGGLMLMPIGLLNENHEPTSYFGVERNFVETAIIPSTLREAGVQGVFRFGDGFTLQTGIVTGPDLTKWDATSAEGQESPLASVHQEGQLAKARDPSYVGALNWRGVPGLQLGVAAIGGGATHSTATFPNAHYLLWDAHARYAPGPFQFSLLYAAGQISNTAELNAPLIGNPSLIPARFDGVLAEAAWRAWSGGDLSLTPFVRWESFNTGRSYAELGAGLTPQTLPTERVVTAGYSLFFGDGLVFKMDYQWFQRANDGDRLNLGMGWSF